MKTTDRLFDVAAKPRRRLAGLLPVPVDPNVCPECGALTVELGMREVALFRHGGYGADRETVVRACAAFCGWAMTRLITERNPRHASAP